MIIDRNYDYYEDERLYSTGDYELDDLLERAFCEGYEFAQREFGFTVAGLNSKIPNSPLKAQRQKSLKQLSVWNTKTKGKGPGIKQNSVRSVPYITRDGQQSISHEDLVRFNP